MNLMTKYSDFPKELNQLSGSVVDCFFQVHKELGAGYPEKIYEEALVIELSRKDISFEKQKTIQIAYKGRALSTHFQPDLIIENQIIVELKSVEKINPVHQSQIYSYLKATRLPLGFLVNFNVPLIKDGINRYKNKHSETPVLRVEKKDER